VGEKKGERILPRPSGPSFRGRELWAGLNSRSEQEEEKINLSQHFLPIHQKRKQGGQQQQVTRKHTYTLNKKETKKKAGKKKTK